MADEHVIERIVRKRQPQRIRLEHQRVGQLPLADFLHAFAEHAARQIDADDFPVLRIKVQRDPRADAHIQHAVGGLDIDMRNGAGNAPANQPPECYIVKERLKVVDQPRARFLHRHWVTSFRQV